jgi:hypothetical protein
VLKIRELAKLRGAPREDAEIELGKLALGNEGGERREKEDRRQQGAEPQEKRAEGEQGDDVLDQVEAAIDDLQPAPIGLAACVLKLVIEVCVFEVGQVQLERLAYDARGCLD